MPDFPDEGGKVELTEVECRELIHSGTVGRVAFVEANGVQILPVNYRVFEGHIVFATNAGRTLARLAAAGLPVAFEIDHIADVYQQGWSVVAQGRTVTRTTPLTLLAINQSAHPPLQPWAGPDRDVIVEIEAVTLTGRRVRLHA